MGYKDADAVLKYLLRETEARNEGQEFDYPALPTNDRFVWAVLALHRHKDTGLCCPSYERLMAMTGLGRTALADSLGRLKRGRRIQVNRSGRSSRYSWELPAPVVETHEERAAEPVREANFSSSFNELQKAGIRTSEVRETAPNRVYNLNSNREPETTDTYTYGVDCLSETEDKEQKQQQQQRQKQPQKHGGCPVPPMDAAVAGFVSVWKRYSAKPVYAEDFSALLAEGRSPEQISDNLRFMFTKSRSTSESPRWRPGDFDVHSSGAFKKVFSEIDRRRELAEQKERQAKERKRVREEETAWRSKLSTPSGTTSDFSAITEDFGNLRFEEAADDDSEGL